MENDKLLFRTTATCRTARRSMAAKGKGLGILLCGRPIRPPRAGRTRAALRVVSCLVLCAWAVKVRTLRARLTTAHTTNYSHKRTRASEHTHTRTHADLRMHMKIMITPPPPPPPPTTGGHCREVPGPQGQGQMHGGRGLRVGWPGLRADCRRRGVQDPQGEGKMRGVHGLRVGHV